MGTSATFGPSNLEPETRRPRTRRSLLPAVVLLLLAACADPVPPGTGGPDPATTRLDVYETVVRHLAGQESFAWNEVVIVRSICANAGEPVEHTDCEEGFATQDESALLGRLVDLAPTVRFVDDPTPMFDDGWMQGEPDAIVMWLGPSRRKAMRSASPVVSGAVACAAPVRPGCSANGPTAGR